MDTPKLRSNRADALDREAFENMLASESFARLTERIRAELGRARDTCSRADAELEVRRAQGASGALEMVLKLPRAILDELKPRK